MCVVCFVDPSKSAFLDVEVQGRDHGKRGLCFLLSILPRELISNFRYQHTGREAGSYLVHSKI